MDKKSAYFSSTQLARAYDLAGPVGRSALHVRNAENAMALGGMRRPDLSVQANAGYRLWGDKFYNMAMDFIGRHPDSLLVIQAIRQGLGTSGFSDDVSAAFRESWFQVLGTTMPPPCSGPDPAVLETWGRAVNDVDAARILPQWLRTGAPIGIKEHIETCGVFPPVDDTAQRDPDDLSTNLAGWTNYASAESEPFVVKKLLDDQAAKGHCKFFDSEAELIKFLGVESVVLSKLALISKPRADGTTKHRLIWDLLRSEVNATVKLGEQIVLPRIQDAVDDAKYLRCAGPEDLEWLVLDVADAFHNIPLCSSERRYACGKIGDTFIVFLVLCMGGRSAPNQWGRYAACLGRLIASLFNEAIFRCEIYVDDPLMAARGNEKQRDKLFTVAMLVLQLTGFPLAWEKGKVGSNVVWIGAHLSSLHDGVQVSIPEDMLDALLEQTMEFSSAVVVPRKSVKSYCGKLSFVAGMVPYLRPFLGMLWAALASRSKLPATLIHVRQFRVALDWLLALLRGRHGPLVRLFPLQEQWADEGSYIATDACPWGMAGVRFEKHKPVQWYATKLTAFDLRKFSATTGESKFNTTWEALALLIAIRLWLPGTCVKAHVRSDSLSALRSMVKLTSTSPALNIIARELALDAVLGLYSIGLAVHIPGVSNTLPDDLSRMWAPKPHLFPAALGGIPESTPPPRDREFWRTASITHRAGKAGAKRRRW